MGCPMMRNLFLTGIAAAAVGAAASTARADSIQAMAPTWCGSYKADPYDTMYKYLDEYSKNGFTDRFMVTLAKTACDKPGDAGRNDEYHLDLGAVTLDMEATAMVVASTP